MAPRPQTADPWSKPTYFELFKLNLYLTDTPPAAGLPVNVQGMKKKVKPTTQK